ncbi:hypothetical protein [Sphingobium yanoikuyae]|uniref:hypothetical protein n=1 Tax=Sphingobium yanoikuyae TaxID=13690 RepID=UPI0022DDC554|nr:hypothetical protein [Sphingobium yanoikuyae]WBQ19465.1 hypothetical protein PAE53_25050 [Sphingobium yanoikuyae]
MPPREVYFEPVNWYRTALHKIGHNAATRIMPRGPWLRVVFWSYAARRFGIIRVLPGTRGGSILAST